MSKTQLELALSPHAHNYTMYLHTSSRMSGPIRGIAPAMFDKDGEFDLTQHEWGRDMLKLKDDIHEFNKQVFRVNLDDNDLTRFYEQEGIKDPWGLKGFFTKGKGLGWSFLAKGIYEDQQGYIMDTMYGCDGNEMICFIQATKQVEFVEEYLSQHSKSKPKIVRIVISAQVPKGIIAIYPHRKNNFKYIPSYYREEKGVVRLPAIIDFPEKYIELIPIMSRLDFPRTKEQMQEIADKAYGKGKATVEKFETNSA